MATTEPQKGSATLGANADVNSLPATTPAGSGRASTSGLFPQITQKPLDEGGIAPERADFNALFKYLGDYIYYIMQGGVFSYLSTYAYTAGNLAMFSGAVYECIAANGPGNVHAPTDTAYWRKLATLQDIPPATTVNDGQLTINVNGSAVATFTANQAGNSTANITIPAAPTKTSQLQNDSGFITASSLPTVNNGTLTIQQDGVTVGSFTANQAGNTTVNLTGGGGGSGPQIFFAAADSTQDAAIRAAGFWRCGRGYAFWTGYGSGAAGGRWYICYAPNGHTITDVDLRWSYAQYVVCAVNSVDSSFPRAGCMSWTTPPTPGGSSSSPHDGVDVPTVGMTSASEVAFPSNPHVPN